MKTIEEQMAEEKRMLSNYRGRRFMACRAADVLSQVVAHLGLDDGSELPPPNRSLPPTPSDAVRLEIENAVALLLRTILAHNDGGVSPSKLNRF
jgi:hypothetical protein